MLFKIVPGKERIIEQAAGIRLGKRLVDARGQRERRAIHRIVERPFPDDIAILRVITWADGSRPEKACNFDVCTAVETLHFAHPVQFPLP